MLLMIKKNVVSPFSPSRVHENLSILHELQFFTMAFMYSSKNWMCMYLCCFDPYQYVIIYHWIIIILINHKKEEKMFLAEQND